MTAGKDGMKRGPSKLGNAELGLAFELYNAGVKLEYIAEGLGCSVSGLKAGMNKARNRGMYDRRKVKRPRHIRLINNIAYHQMKDRGHV